MYEICIEFGALAFHDMALGGSDVVSVTWISISVTRKLKQGIGLKVCWKNVIECLVTDGSCIKLLGRIYEEDKYFFYYPSVRNYLKLIFYVSPREAFSHNAVSLLFVKTKWNVLQLTLLLLNN